MVNVIRPFYRLDRESYQKKRKKRTEISILNRLSDDSFVSMPRSEQVVGPLVSMPCSKQVIGPLVSMPCSEQVVGPLVSMPCLNRLSDHLSLCLVLFVFANISISLAHTSKSLLIFLPHSFLPSLLLLLSLSLSLPS